MSMHGFALHVRSSSLLPFPPANRISSIFTHEIFGDTNKKGLKKQLQKLPGHFLL